MPGKLGVSPATFYAARGSDSKTSDKTWRRLERLEREILEAEGTTTGTGLLEEASPKPYDATPSRTAIEARVRAFLDAAERIPGGLGYASIQVQLHLDPSRLAGLLRADDALDQLRRLAGEGEEEQPRKVG